MTLQLALPPELISRLKTEAARLGEPMERVAERLLDERLPPSSPLESGRRLLADWTREAEAMSDQDGEANAAVLRSIDAHRLSDRPLFTEALKEEAQ